MIVFATNAREAAPNQKNSIRVIAFVKNERLLCETSPGQIIISGVIRGLPLEISVGFETGGVEHLFESFRGQIIQEGRCAQMLVETSFTIKLIQARFPFGRVATNFPQPLPANFQQLRATIGDDRGRARRAPERGDLAEHFARFEPGGVIFA